MLKPKLTQEPADNLKGAYVQKGGEWILDSLADDHPLLAHNKTLLQEKAAVETERDAYKASVGNLEREVSEARAKTVPHGCRAVSVEIADLGSAAKASGISKDELSTLKTRIETFEREKAEATENEIRALVADSLGLRRETFSEHAAAKGLKFAERREKVDGKDVSYFVLLNENGSEAERAGDYVKTKAAYLPPAQKGDAAGDKGFQFPGESDAGSRQLNTIEKEMAAQASTGRYSL